MASVALPWTESQCFSVDSSCELCSHLDLHNDGQAGAVHICNRPNHGEHKHQSCPQVIDTHIHILQRKPHTCLLHTVLMSVGLTAAAEWNCINIKALHTKCIQSAGITWAVMLAQWKRWQDIPLGHRLNYPEMLWFALAARALQIAGHCKVFAAPRPMLKGFHELRKGS